MVKYLQNKKTGKLAGSIGDGKQNIPTAHPTTNPTQTPPLPGNPIASLITNFSKTHPTYYAETPEETQTFNNNFREQYGWDNSLRPKSFTIEGIKHVWEIGFNAEHDQSIFVYQKEDGTVKMFTGYGIHSMASGKPTYDLGNHADKEQEFTETNFYTEFEKLDENGQPKTFYSRATALYDHITGQPDLTNPDIRKARRKAAEELVRGEQARRAARRRAILNR